MNVRALAAKVVSEVLAGHSLSETLPRESKDLSPQNQSLLQAISFGVLRFYNQLDVILNSLLKKPFTKKKIMIFMHFC